MLLNTHQRIRTTGSVYNEQLIS